ncbi:MAG: ACP S-malonyltransferase [Parachlamydiaceae bacterium]|nr:ACP S-malonyltransferase [Parachlamydiaceae bacterium]
MTNSSKIAFLFPGQGAQYPGMAKDFFQAFAVARQTFEEADDLLGRKLSTIIFEGPETELTETKNSQVGIFVASMAILRVLQEQMPDLKPAVCAGLSLGEYTALCASGRLGFADTLRLVDQRGRFMNDACEETKGTMAVVLGLEGQEVEVLVNQLAMPHDIWSANFNCPGQTVISGTARGIELATAALKTKGAKRVLPLQVHGAFHSGLMASAERRLKEYIQAALIKNSAIEFVMNVPGDFVSDTEEIKDNLIKQVTLPVRWEQGIRKMKQKDVKTFVEIGCGKALSGFNKRIIADGISVSLEKISDLSAIEEMRIL